LGIKGNVNGMPIVMFKDSPYWPGRNVNSAALEILDFAFVFHGGGPRLERTKVAPFSGLGVFLFGVKTVFA
jgi:hypothetical protein